MEHITLKILVKSIYFLVQRLLVLLLTGAAVLHAEYAHAGLFYQQQYNNSVCQLSPFIAAHCPGESTVLLDTL